MSKELNSITRAFLLCLLISFSVMVGFTQSIEHNCKVIVFEMNTDKMEYLGELNSSFDSEKTLNVLTRTFQIPKTKMFVSASVLYDIEPGNPKTNPPDQMFLTLILGKRRFKNGFDDLSNIASVKKDILRIAAATFPLESFEKGKTSNVMLFFLGKKQVINVTLECKK